MLALIAGQGALPTRVAAAVPKWPVVACLEGFAPDELIPELTFRLETLGTFLQLLAERGVHEVCFAGAIRRPRIEMDRIDLATAPLVPRVLEALKQGDDAALRIVIEIFEDAGFTVRGVDALMPGLLPPASCPTVQQPDDAARAEIARGTELLDALSSQDVGQACVVSEHQILAIEAAGGTDWMLRSLQDREGSTPPLPTGGVLVKAPKLGQDRRIDLPTIGPGTVKAAAAAGLKGICVPAGGVMILSVEDVIAEADAAGLFLWIREAVA